MKLCRTVAKLPIQENVLFYRTKTGLTSGRRGYNVYQKQIFKLQFEI